MESGGNERATHPLCAREGFATTLVKWKVSFVAAKVLPEPGFRDDMGKMERIELAQLLSYEIDVSRRHW